LFSSRSEATCPVQTLIPLAQFLKLGQCGQVLQAAQAEVGEELGGGAVELGSAVGLVSGGGDQLAFE
jgi:hypothetical protein